MQPHPLLFYLCYLSCTVYTPDKALMCRAKRGVVPKPLSAISSLHSCDKHAILLSSILFTQGIWDHFRFEDRTPISAIPWSIAASHLEPWHKDLSTVHPYATVKVWMITGETGPSVDQNWYCSLFTNPCLGLQAQTPPYGGRRNRTFCTLRTYSYSYTPQNWVNWDSNVCP